HKSYAQLDNVHYLQPMINYNYGTDGMMKAENVYISTPSETEITVNVTKMDGAEFPIYVHYYTETGGHISSGWANDGKVKISKYKFARTSLGASPGNTPTLRPLSESFQNISASLGGLTFKSNKEFYVNYRAHANGHAVSFLSKGRRAVGKNFHWGGAPARHRAATTNINNFVTVTALEDGGTDVTFSGLEPGINVMKGTSKYNISGTTFTRNLNKGESIVVRVKLEGNNGSAAVNTLHRNGWMGTKITSTKNIVVTNGGLAMQGGAEGNADYGIEQITPIEYLGTEHMVMQGLGAAADEKVYVIATEPSTYVIVNGNTYQLLNNVGDWVEIPGT
ncbi:MAG: IgGFc-binding protein, partial [Weeksellaceae bacterium]|nr:IgGFc-binding protein [Weeksellaceae bacterium]